MSKRTMLIDRKRTRELSPGLVLHDAKKQELEQLRVSLAEPVLGDVALVEVVVKPCAKTMASIDSYQMTGPLSVGEMIEELLHEAENLQALRRERTPSISMNEQGEILMKRIAGYINQRAQQLEQKGVIGKAKKMQCEALLYSLTQALKKKNFNLPKMKLATPHS